MGKVHYAKTELQKRILEEFFNRNKGPWKKHQILNLMTQTLLTRHQVYKWLWDKKQIMKKMLKQKNQGKILLKTKGEKANQCKEQYMQDNQSQSSNRQAMIKKVRFKNYNIEVPENIQQAVEFIVPTRLDNACVKILKKHGWKLIRSYKMYRKNEQMNPYQFSESNKLQIDQSSHQLIRRSKRLESKCPNDQLPLFPKFKKNVFTYFKDFQENHNDISYESPVMKNITIEDLSQCQNRKSKTKYFDVNESNSNQDKIFESSGKVSSQ